MTDYTHIAKTTKVTLGNDSWIGNVANVKTIEDFLREFPLQGGDDQMFFLDAELPAISIDPKANDKEQDFDTVGEIREDVFAEVIIVSGHADPQTAENKHDEIIKNVERVLEDQRTSILDLGYDALVKDVVTETDDPFKKNNKTYYISRTAFTVDITRNLELQVYGDDSPNFEDSDEFF